MKQKETVAKSLEESLDEQLNLSDLENVEGGASETNAVSNCSSNNCNGGNCASNCGTNCVSNCGTNCSKNCVSLPIVE